MFIPDSRVRSCRQGQIPVSELIKILKYFVARRQNFSLLSKDQRAKKKNGESHIKTVS